MNYLHTEFHMPSVVVHQLLLSNGKKYRFCGATLTKVL